MIFKRVLFQRFAGRERILVTTRRRGRAASGGDPDEVQSDVRAFSSSIRRTAFGSLIPTHWAILPATPTAAGAGLVWQRPNLPFDGHLAIKIQLGENLLKFRLQRGRLGRGDLDAEFHAYSQSFGGP